MGGDGGDVAGGGVGVGAMGHAQGCAVDDGVVGCEVDGGGVGDGDVERRLVRHADGGEVAGLFGAAATLGLEAEAIDSDLGGVDDLLRRSPPSLLRVGADGRRLLLVLRGGRRALEVLPPDLRPRRVALAAVRGELCEPPRRSAGRR